MERSQQSIKRLFTCSTYRLIENENQLYEVQQLRTRFLFWTSWETVYFKSFADPTGYFNTFESFQDAAAYYFTALHSDLSSGSAQRDALKIIFNIIKKARLQ